MLDTTVESVTSALKRARATVRGRLDRSPHDAPAPAPGSPVEVALVARLSRAFETGDVDALVALLTDDVWVTMPPVPLEYQGRELAARFNATVTFRHGRTYTLVPTRANGQLAFGAYLDDPLGGVRHANGLVVLTLSGDQVRVLTRFDNSVLDLFGLPRSLPS
jgi:RNA polymerase sigma-70 factor (ECF subfamily)